PKESLQRADAVCVGEGELTVKSLKDGINQAKLLTSEELSSQPFAYNDFDCTIYDNGFKQLTQWSYIKYSGLLYRTLWVRGCPYQCTYCANSAFIKLDK